MDAPTTSGQYPEHLASPAVKNRGLYLCFLNIKSSLLISLPTPWPEYNRS